MDNPLEEVTIMMKRILFSGRAGSRSWFWWGINIGVFLALIAWWWLRNQSKEQERFVSKLESLILPPDDDPGADAQTVSASRQAAAVEPEPETPDDLKVIEGIGPRSAQVLAGAGILTFAGLAAMEPDAIREILRAAGVRVPYPATWPEQAALAAAGEWGALDELQNSLVGGRRL